MRMRINPWLMKLLPSSSAVLLALFALEPQSARAQSCDTDPFGAEVCLPEINPVDDDDLFRLFATGATAASPGGAAPVDSVP